MPPRPAQRAFDHIRPSQARSPDQSRYPRRQSPRSSPTANTFANTNTRRAASTTVLCSATFGWLADCFIKTSRPRTPTNLAVTHNPRVPRHCFPYVVHTDAMSLSRAGANKQSPRLDASILPCSSAQAAQSSFMISALGSSPLLSHRVRLPWRNRIPSLV
ncbi:hypothetical protein JOL62DRAFT_408648 [Phyllosticta paracitricarpa]|uniref:Uncharacterized protein n=1 Tax=Phyllosticta paracitricarpa TaxID=2016321 RepID=A0ABR1NH14_9PEZI